MDEMKVLQLFTDITEKVMAMSQGPFADNLMSLKVEEIGDGNLNDVWRVILPDDSMSLILKHAPPYIKCIGPDYPLSVDRGKIEMNALVKFFQIYRGSVPNCYCYEPELKTMLMEDLRGYEVLQKQLIEGKVDLPAIRKLAEMIGRIHKETHVASLPAKDFEEMQKQFQNEALSDLTRKYIFVNPYEADETTNKVEAEVKSTAEKIYANAALKAEAEKFKQLFLTKKEVLIHGDLHTGSVLVKDGDPKMFDLEFAMMGPAAFDVGMLLANYIFTYHQHMLTPENNDAHRRVSYKMLDVCNTTMSVYLENMTAPVTDRDQYVSDFMSEVAGFAGCELIRRTIGVAHVPGLEGNGSMEKEACESGVRLLGANQRIHTCSHLLNIALMLT